VRISTEPLLVDLRSIAIEAEYTRYPVINESEQVIGFIDVKDILRISESVDETESITARDLARDIVVVPETLRVDELLAKFQSEQRQMAVVIDEWGAFEGLVTVEDVVEEVVGDIRDQFDLEEPNPSIERLDTGGYTIDGDVPLTAVNETLNTSFESEDFDTLGGFVLSRLGRAPEPSDTIEEEDYQLRVDEVDGARISTVTASIKK